MTQYHDYDDAFDPPAPVLQLRVSAPGADASVLLTALVDTGADMTVVPGRLASRLSLPIVGNVRVSGATGSRSNCPIYAAAIEVEGRQQLLEVLALGREALVGRDLLRSWNIGLDGPRSRLHIRRPPR